MFVGFLNCFFHSYVVEEDTYTGFQHTGWWYDYITGDSINVSDIHMTIPLSPGDWKIFTDIRLDTPDMINPIDTSITLVNQILYYWKKKSR